MEDKTEQKTDIHFHLNAKGYIQFDKNLVIDSRYQLINEIILDEELGTTAKGRYGSVFRVKDLKEGKIKALKINRIPPAEEDAKRQAAKDQLKKQQMLHIAQHTKQHNKNNNALTNHKSSTNDIEEKLKKRRHKTVEERYKSSCKREIGVLKRITRKNADEQIPCLVLYDYGEYLGHTYMIFPVYDQTLQQHLINCQRYQDDLEDQTDDQNNNSNHHHKNKKNNNNNNNECPNALIHPDDLWAMEEQLISALTYIHRVCNVMHLDFKPKNIMINTYGYDIIKYSSDLHLIKLKKNAITLIDFSVSAKAPKKADLDELRYTGNFGTRRYRPPEMIYGSKWNRSVDTYGTCMIVLECVRLYPIIDTTYYKKKKILKYKKKLKKMQDDGQTIKIHPNYKQLDIWEVLYLIMQQIGFCPKDYWEGLSLNDKYLFPPVPTVENITKKGKKSKLFENSNKLIKNSNNSPANNKNNKKNHKIAHDDHHDDDDNDNLTESDSSEEVDMTYDRYSNKLKAHSGNIWSIFELYGDDVISKFKLDIMKESLRKMVRWDATKRIKPEECLQIYFPQNATPERIKNDLNDNYVDD